MQGQHPAVDVGDDLHLDVAAPLDVGLDQQRVVAEGCRRLASGRGDRVGELVGPPDDPHPLAATAGRCLHQHREDHLGRRGVEVVRGHHRDPRPDSDPPGRVLAAHLLHHPRGRPDQDEAGVLDGAGERGPLGQEAVARMDRGDPGRQGGGDDALDVEVVGHPDRVIGRPDVGSGGVGVTEDRHATDPQPPTGAQHPDGDLATVGDQHRGDRPRPFDLDAGGGIRRLHDHIRKTP